MLKFKTSGMKSLLFVLAISISGCSITADEIEAMYDQPGLPGYLTKDVSEFDGTSRITLAPSFIGDGGNLLRLGLRWNSSLPDNKMILVAEWGEPENFDPKMPLKLNIDGTRLELPPVDKRGYGEFIDKVYSSATMLSSSSITLKETHKQYWISRSELSQIIGAQKVVVRVELLKSYWEERLEPTVEDIQAPKLWAKMAFAKFLSEQSSISN